MAKLSHRNIIRLEAFVEDAEKDMFWLVLPWEANGNLREFILFEDYKLEVPELSSLVRMTIPRQGYYSRRFFQIKDVISGLVYLHSQNICHGDLKAVCCQNHAL